MNKKINIIFIFAITVIITGCTSHYTPPKQSARNLATIQETKLDKVSHIDVISINESPTHSLKDKIGLNSPFSKEFWIDESIGSESFQIEPGDCTVELHYSEPLGDAHGTIDFVAKAGKIYQLYGMKETTGRWLKSQWMIFYLIEKDSSELIGDYPQELRNELISFHNKTY